MQKHNEVTHDVMKDKQQLL